MRLVMPAAGRAALASAIKTLPIAAAVGRGDGVWTDQPPDIPVTATGLVDPFAVVRARRVDFVSPDSDGTIEAPDGTLWAVSATPTKYLHVDFVLGFADGPEHVLREYALYLSTSFIPDTLPGQTYVPINQVTDLGSLLALKRFAPIERQGVRVTFGDILTF